MTSRRRGYVMACAWNRFVLPQRLQKSVSPGKWGGGGGGVTFSRGLRRSRKPPVQSRPPVAVVELGHVSSAAMEQGVTKYFCNRNPRNLELLGVAEKPKGFQTRRWRVDYYHRLMLDVSSRHVSAYVEHNNGTRVVEASTKEFCIARHLYKTCDVSAAYNIGRVVAERCKETGLYRVMWEHKDDRNHRKVRAFMKAIAESGLRLNEPRPRKTLPPPGTLPR